jgi:hypothetical protein
MSETADAGPPEILGALADGTRLRMLAHVAQHGGSVDDALAATGGPPKQARKHLARLLATGLLEQSGGSLIARLDRVRAAADELQDTRRAGRLKHIPRAKDARRAALMLASDGVPPDREFNEAEINALLKPVYDDHVALRRYLVDDGLLARSDDGRRYWRT